MINLSSDSNDIFSENAKSCKLTHFLEENNTYNYSSSSFTQEDKHLTEETQLNFILKQKIKEENALAEEIEKILIKYSNEIKNLQKEINSYQIKNNQSDTQLLQENQQLRTQIQALKLENDILRGNNEKISEENKKLNDFVKGKLDSKVSHIKMKKPLICLTPYRSVDEESTRKYRVPKKNKEKEIFSTSQKSESIFE